MHSSKMVKTAKPISRSLYTDKTRREKKERNIFFFFFATTINTVFTDEVMQFELRGQQQEASERHPGLVKRRVKHRNKGPKLGTNPVYMKPIQSIFYFKSTANAPAFWCSSYT